YNNKIKLHIGGDGDVKKLLKIIQENDLRNIVEYLGWVSNNEKNNLLLHSDIYMLPSYAEGLPVSILEAMSYGMPIISTNVGGIPEIVKHQYNGLLFQPGDIDAIENALQFFINQPQKIEEYGNHSLELIQPYFPKAVIEQLTQCYTSILTPSEVSVASHA
ncbi:MAG TPA: glycosyltransferase, partial [Chitinophagaceae bacterium]|nr:glycosyltransferase [Chitinophagaceae bacterium]